MHCVMKKIEKFVAIDSVILIALFLITGLFSCSDEKTVPEIDELPTEEEEEPTPTLPENIKLSANTKILTPNIASYVEEVKDGELLFNIDTPKEKLPKIGEILLNYSLGDKFSNGFLGKVIEVDATEKYVRILIENVALDEAFIELSVDTMVNISDHIETVVNADGDSIPFRLNPISRADIENSVSIKVDNKLKGAHNEVIGFINGEIRAALKHHMVCKIENGQLQEFSTEIEPVFSIDLELKLGIEKEFKDSIYLGSMYSIPIVTGILVYRPVIDYYLNFEASGKLSIGTEIRYEKKLPPFRILYANGQWGIPEKQTEKEEPKSPFSFTGEVTLEGELGIGPHLYTGIQFYQGLVSVGIRSKAMLKASSQMSIDMGKEVTEDDYKLWKRINLKETFGVSCDFMIKAGFLKFLTEAHTAELELFTATIYDGPFFPDLKKPVVKKTAIGKNVVAYPSPTEAPLPARYGIEIVNEKEEVIKTEFVNDTLAYVNELKQETEVSIEDLPEGEYTARPIIEYCETKVYSDEKEDFQIKNSIRDILMSIYNNNGGRNWTYQKNWGTDLPVTVWEGIEVTDDGTYIFDFFRNKELTGTVSIVNCQESILFGYGGDQITGLYIKNCPNLLVGGSISGFPNLKTAYLDNIKLDDHRQVRNDTVIDSYTFRFLDMSQIESVDIRNCVGKLMFITVEECPMLKQFRCENLTFDKKEYEALETSVIIGDCKELRELYFNNNTDLKSFGVARCGKLDKVELTNNTFTDYVTIGDVVCEYLTCTKQKFSHESPLYLSFFDSQIKHLYLKNISEIHDPSLPMGLESCYAENCWRTWDFSGQKNLKTVELYECNGPSNLGGCTQLEKLICQFSNFADSGILDIRNLPKLISVDCTNNQGLVDILFDSHINAMHLDCRYNSSLKKIIPDFVSESAFFMHDARYNYSWDEKKDKLIVVDRGSGWWYPGEPQSGRHSRN